MPEHEILLQQPLRFLTAEEISMIDRFVATRESGGDARLVVRNGRLRFLTWTNDVDLHTDDGGKTKSA